MAIRTALIAALLLAGCQKTGKTVVVHQDVDPGKPWPVYVVTATPEDAAMLKKILSEKKP